MTWKIHANKLDAKLGHPREDWIHTAKNQLDYSVKWTLDICEDYATETIKQKLLRKLAEEKDLKPGKMIYIGISSQKKSSYGGSKNWNLIQDSATKQKWCFFMKVKEYGTEKSPLS